jgi:hypothetical protein
MKKFLVLMFALLMAISFWSCINCGGNPSLNDPIKTELVVNQAISLDNQYMFLNYGEDYRWFETCVLMDDFLDEETDGSINMIVNVYQVVKGDGKTFDVTVFKFQHLKDGTVLKDSVDGFWIEDYPLNNSAINIDYKKAFSLVQEVNLPKPHSKNAILRNPLGPISVNPQWVFGNIREQIWVDATTGEIRESNPAFPDDLKMPLGEWP